MPTSKGQLLTTIQQLYAYQGVVGVVYDVMGRNQRMMLDLLDVTLDEASSLVAVAKKVAAAIMTESSECAFEQ